MQASHEELEGQVGGQLEWWRGQLEDLKAQLRGEATRVLELQKKAYNAKMAQEAAVQVGAALSCFVCPYGNRPLLSAPYGSRSLFFFPYVDKVFLVCPVWVCNLLCLLQVGTSCVSTLCGDKVFCVTQTG